MPKRYPVLEATYPNAPAEILQERLADEFYTIEQARKALNVGYKVYVRRLCRQGKLKAVKIYSKGRLNWAVLKSSVAEYNATTARSTGRRRWVAHFSLEEEEKVRTALDKAEVEYDLELAFKGSE